jgi:hypothetical protein
MNRKLKNTLALLTVLIVILIAGGIFVFGIQRSKISDKTDRLKELKAHAYNKESLAKQYDGLVLKSRSLDSILASREFNIPQNLSSIKFFDFVTDVTSGFSPKTHVDVEYADNGQDKEFSYYQYNLKGSGKYSEIYQLIYAIEQSKELKKLSTINMSNLISTDDDGIPFFDVKFGMNVKVYYSQNDRFATAKLVENDLRSRDVYDAFYPLIRTEIPPNVDNLLDVQGAKLLALVPEGAFLSDSKGKTYLLWEGEPVYLGYLTKIDYDNKLVHFILNKGGIIDKVDLQLQKEEDNKNKKK